MSYNPTESPMQEIFYSPEKLTYQACATCPAEEAVESITTCCGASVKG